MSAERNVTVIERGTEIIGMIRTDNDLVVKGAIIGNVEAAGDIDLDGFIKGDVKAETADINNAELRGNLSTSGKTIVGDSAAIFGDVSCADLDISGSIKGSIESRGLCNVATGAIISGDISSYDVQIAKGATVQGRLIHINDENQDPESRLDVDEYFAHFDEDGAFLVSVDSGFKLASDQEKPAAEENVQQPSLLENLSEKADAVNVDEDIDDIE